jgi:uncharacterized Zn finger protein
MEEETTKICPICGSADLYYEAGGSIGFVYHCKNCGHVSSFVVDANTEMAQTIRAEYAKKEGTE